MNGVISELVHRGVTILCPKSVYIGDEVDPARISRDNVVLHPGTRLTGAATLVGPGCEIGAETPATLDDCALGKRVRFKGGFATKSSMLDDVTVGSGAQIREGCVLEEHATVGHNVGLKQTILMPYSTLGSLINFCDAMLAGGTGRKDHSEVGSGFIHFNFTPDGTKATASRFGDVPRGVFLHEERIFLGGQTGAVGPLRVGYGSVIAAGSLLRQDIEDDQFIITGRHAEVRRPVGDTGHATPSKLAVVIDHNIDYIAQLIALDTWYSSVRWAFCERSRLGSRLNIETRNVLDGAIQERVNRLRELAAVSDAANPHNHPVVPSVDAAIQAIVGAEVLLDADVIHTITKPSEQRDVGYLDALADLDDDVLAKGQAWLQRAVDELIGAANRAMAATTTS